jgi:hypothetical protein
MMPGFTAPRTFGAQAPWMQHSLLVAALAGNEPGAEVDVPGSSLRPPGVPWRLGLLGLLASS